MFPTIFSYKGLEISSYGLMLVVAFLTCNYLLRRDLVKKGQNPDIADDITFRAAVGGIIGSKIYYLIENPSSIEQMINASSMVEAIKIFGSGLVFLGGLIGGMISVTLYLRKNNIQWLDAADWVAPYLILGHAIGRIGCFLVGDCYGTVCTLPWGLQFAKGLPATTYENFYLYYPKVFDSEYFQSTYSSGDVITVHPTQLYEFFTGVLIFFYLLHIRKKDSYPGLIMFEYLFLAGLARFLVEFIRLNPSYLFGLSGAQIISALMMIVSSYFMYINRGKLKTASSG